MREILDPFIDEQIAVLKSDNGARWEVYLPEKTNQRLIFQNEHCAFTPVGFLRTDFGWMPMGYKVVTAELGSLGLRRNPSPLTFPVDQWVFEQNNLDYGNKDYGGIWTAHRLGNAKTLAKYCLEEKSMQVRIFLTAIYNPVAFVGNYRVKSEGVMLIKEIWQ